jgi:alanyl-tRNA synthetase
MYDKINKVNTTIEYYNTLSAAQQESYKDVVEAAKQEYEDFKEQIESYDTLVSETIPELEKNIREKLDEQTAIRIEHFKISVEL